MNKLTIILAALLGLSLVTNDADARRLGGGSSFGKQRSIVTPSAPKPAPQAPGATPANPAQQPSGASRWLGPLAGLALGAGLASLFMNNGFAGGFGAILMILLIAAAAIFVMRMLRARQASPPLRYAGANSPGVDPRFSTNFGGAATVAATPTVEQRYPPGFDAEEFVRHAKANFIRLQEANDKRDLATLRDFMTPEFYAELVAQMGTGGADVLQQTNVVTLNAEVLEVVTEGDVYVASVRFSGMIREEAAAAAAPFSEMWHLEKPVRGTSGWLISGIQQD